MKELKIGFEKTNMKIKISEIWNENKFLEKSILDKISFNKLIDKVVMIENKFDEKNLQIYLENKKNKNEKYIPLSQSICTLNEYNLRWEIIEKIFNKKRFESEIKREEMQDFLIDILTKCDLILPKMKFQKKDPYNLYLFPFLFQNEKPKSILLDERSCKKKKWKWIMNGK